MAPAKRKAEKSFVHKHNVNPNARESDERRIAMLVNMEIKRYQRKVDSITNNMKNYIPIEILNEQKKKKIDPLYDLKGAARPAAEYYKDPKMTKDIDPINVFDLFNGRIYDHDEGKNLLKAMLKLSIEMHNSGYKSKDSIKVLKNMLELDKDDRIRARYHLLRVYLDLADAENARKLLDSYPEDKHCCFVYTRALIEHISLLLNETGSSVDLRDQRLLEAFEVNPYGLYLLAYCDYFKEALEHVDTTCQTDAGSIGKIMIITHYYYYYYYYLC